MGKENSVSENSLFGRVTTAAQERQLHKIADRLPGLRTCEKIAKRRAIVRKAVLQGACEGASPQRAVNERTTRPDGLSCSRPQGCVSFWLGLRCLAVQRTEGRQPAEGSRQGDAMHRQRRCGYCRRPHALAKPKIQQQRGTS